MWRSFRSRIARRPCMKRVLSKIMMSPGCHASGLSTRSLTAFTPATRSSGGGFPIRESWEKSLAIKVASKKQKISKCRFVAEHRLVESRPQEVAMDLSADALKRIGALRGRIRHGCVIRRARPQPESALGRRCRLLIAQPPSAKRIPDRRRKAPHDFDTVANGGLAALPWRFDAPEETDVGFPGFARKFGMLRKRFVTEIDGLDILLSVDHYATGTLVENRSTAQTPGEVAELTEIDLEAAKQTAP